MTAALTRRVLACLGLLVGLLVLPARAHAGVLVQSAPPCNDPPLSRPFLPWLDPARYALLPDGAFSGRADGWQLRRASVVSDNEPYRVSGDAVSAALQLPAGSSATSPTVCVGLEHPTLRFFARNTGSLLGALRVDVRFEDAAGNVHALPIGLVAGDRAWHPTLPLVVVANLLPLLPGAHTPVDFRFTPVGLGSSWEVDDIYLDPYRKG